MRINIRKIKNDILNAYEAIAIHFCFILDPQGMICEEKLNDPSNAKGPATG